MSEYILTPKMKAWASANGYDAELHVDFFNDYVANKGGKPYKDLDAAFRNCVRADWGNLRRSQQMTKRFAPPVQAFKDTYVAPPITGEAMPDAIKAFLKRGGSR